MKKRKVLPWIYSLPAMMLTGAIVVFPILYTGYISFTNMNLYHWTDFQIVGFANYGRALLKIDSGFMEALGITLLWTVVNIVLQVVVSYFIALALNREDLKWRRLYKTLLMFPWAMPAYVSILVWRVGMFNSEFGLLNKWLSQMGFSKFDFLSRNIPAFFSCLVLNLWMALPFMIMMIDGALKSIDKSMYESAELDGAGFVKKNIYITIPSLQKIIMPAIILTTFTTFKQFDIVYLLTMQKGSLSGATLQTVLTYAHQKAFVSNNYGLSSAVSIVIFGIIILFSFSMNPSIKGEKVE